MDISIQGEPDLIEFQLSPGEIAYVLGANGTGKSALMHRLNIQHPGSRWISAHRRTWLDSGGSDITSLTKEQNDKQRHDLDRRPDSRWKDHNPALRPNIAIFDLIQRRVEQNQEIVDAVRAKKTTKASQLAEKNEDPLVTLSELLRSANLPFSFSVDRNAAIVAHKPGSDQYSVAEMSDGERNALLLVAETLTVPPGTLILVDEPERHLHRSIIAPLLNGLFAKRSDCEFVISTHEVMLPFDNPGSKVLLVRGCTYKKGSVASWDIDLLDSQFGIDEDLKRDILGARRNILFTEGEEQSLDKALYARLFPDVTVIAKGSRRNVENAVMGIMNSQELHWLKAYGIVDNDGRLDNKTERMKHDNIYAIDVYAVESLYYDSRIQEELTKRRSNLTGDDPQIRLDKAKAEALKAIASDRMLFCERTAKRRLRESILARLPGPESTFPHEQVCISLDAPQILKDAQKEFNEAIDNEDLDTIIRRYPIKDSPIPERIAKHLGFDSPKEYERAVIKLLDDSNDILRYVKNLVGELPDVIATHQSDPSKDNPA